MALKLAKSGYGTFEQILEMPINIVIKMMHYENFLNEFEKEAHIINQPEKK